MSQINAKIQLAIMLILSVSISAIMLGYLFYHSDIAPGYTDSSYYFINIYNSFDVVIQATMFGPLWESFFGHQLISTHQKLNILSVYLIGSLLTYQCTRFFAGGGLLEKIAIACLGGCCFLFYFSALLLGPHYNNLTLVFISLSWMAFTWMWSAIQKPRQNWELLAASACFGIAMSCLILAKITSGLVAGTAMGAIFVISCWSKLNGYALARIVAGGVGGILIVLSWLWLHGYSPVWLVENFFHGLEFTYTLLPYRTDPLLHEARQLASYSHYVGHVFWTFGMSTLLWAVIMIAGLIYLGDSRSAHSIERFSVPFAIVFCVAWLGYNADFFFASDRNTNLAALNILCLCIFVFGAAFMLINRSRISKLVLVAFPVLLVSPILTSIGTNGAWQYTVLSPGLIFAAALSGVLGFRSEIRSVAYVPVLALILATLVASWVRTEYLPVQLGGRLSTANVSFELGSQNEQMRAPANLARFYQKLTPFKFQAKDENTKPPVLIDLSGRGPYATLHLGLTPSRAAWTMTGHPGSDDALAYVVNMLSDEELRNAWVHDWDEAQSRVFPRLSSDVLNESLKKVDMQFPQDYELLIGPNAQSPALLYRPKQIK